MIGFLLWFCRALQLANALKTNCSAATLNLSCSYESLTDVADSTRSSWNSPQKTAPHGWRYCTRLSRVWRLHIRWWWYFCLVRWNIFLSSNLFCALMDLHALAAGIVKPNSSLCSGPSSLQNRHMYQKWLCSFCLLCLLWDGVKEDMKRSVACPTAHQSMFLSHSFGPVSWWTTFS